MKRAKLLLLLAPFAAALVAGCAKREAESNDIRHYSMDTTEGIISLDNISIDPSIKVHGTSSLKITVSDSMTVRLYETGEIDVENARLLYRARLRTENARGPVYLEMWCRFARGREYFSRGVAQALTGTNDWSSVEIPFVLKAGENPDNVKLNLVIGGPGTVWIDDVHLSRAPL